MTHLFFNADSNGFGDVSEGDDISLSEYLDYVDTYVETSNSWSNPNAEFRAKAFYEAAGSIFNPYIVDEDTLQVVGLLDSSN
jgi:hypothetical protein